jgi:rfaE bifunctional protein nucleotidyltransferase chain/domain/rfaE bifunctional protein kinase chain/domain
VSGLVVVGDVLLDIDLTGPANRLCPDAPGPVIDLADEIVRAGGAGLAASLAASDGLGVRLVTALADDADGRRLRAALGGIDGIDVVSATAPGATPVKTRIRSADRSLARVDRGGTTPEPGAVPVTDAMLATVADADAVLVADYGRGLAANPALRAILTKVASRKPVVWDPHPRGPDPIRGAWLVTPNRAEAEAVLGTSGKGLGWASSAALELRHEWRVRAVAVTLGSGGAVLNHGGAPIAIPAPKVTVTDPCGAGDRFGVTAVSGLLRGRSLDEAVSDAVTAAAAFLAAGGVSRQDTPASAAGDAETVIARTRAAGGVVVATGGCFDLLHTGHLRTLRAARALGDCLVVCLNSDSSVRALKGADRPINNQTDRAELLAGLDCVDAVAIFTDNTPIPLLNRLRPDIWVKGGDYSESDLPEAEVVRSWGGHAVVVPYHAGHSTTQLASALGAIG